jgi:hypothetical protein
VHHVHFDDFASAQQPVHHELMMQNRIPSRIVLLMMTLEDGISCKDANDASLLHAG